MNIVSKFKIGDEVYSLYYDNEMHIYKDKIEEIIITDKGIRYILASSCDDIDEEDIVLINDTTNLLDKINNYFKERS